MCIRDRARDAAGNVATSSGITVTVSNQTGDTTAPTVSLSAVSYTHLRAHETPEHLVCRLLLEKKKTTKQ